jgi:hypothetical protein
MAVLCCVAEADVDRVTEGRALGNFATVHRDLRRYSEAIYNYRLSCRIFKDLKDRQMVRTGRMNFFLCFRLRRDMPPIESQLLYSESPLPELG